MPRRNDPCPCRSGRKYKLCCGRPGQERDPRARLQGEVRATRQKLLRASKSQDLPCIVCGEDGAEGRAGISGSGDALMIFGTCREHLHPSTYRREAEAKIDRYPSIDVNIQDYLYRNE